jgi:hypothetical protein
MCNTAVWKLVSIWKFLERWHDVIFMCICDFHVQYIKFHTGCFLSNKMRCTLWYYLVAVLKDFLLMVPAAGRRCHATRLPLPNLMVHRSWRLSISIGLSVWIAWWMNLWSMCWSPILCNLQRSKRSGGSTRWCQAPGRYQPCKLQIREKD